jgi:hypothetical protein
MVVEIPEPGGAKASGIAPRLLIRSYFSTRLLWAAFHASDDAREIEAAHTGEPIFNVEHNGFVLSSIVLSAAFLEAAVNEFFQDAHDEHLPPDGYLAPLPSTAIRAMAAVWKGTDDGRRLTTLEKWQLMLVLSGKEPLDSGREPFQPAKLVGDLRNMIVHYRPEDLAVDEGHKLERSLKGRFAPNALWDSTPDKSWWPNRCLGHGCARWAATSVVAFADRVCNELGISPNYRRVATGGGYGKQSPY